MCPIPDMEIWKWSRLNISHRHVDNRKTQKSNQSLWMTQAEGMKNSTPEFSQCARELEQLSPCSKSHTSVSTLEWSTPIVISTWLVSSQRAHCHLHLPEVFFNHLFFFFHYFLFRRWQWITHEPNAPHNINAWSKSAAIASMLTPLCHFCVVTDLVCGVWSAKIVHGIKCFVQKYAIWNTPPRNSKQSDSKGEAGGSQSRP